MSGIVYTIDDEGYIVAEQKMDFNMAVYEYMGKVNYRGQKYHVSVEGKEIPYKRRGKKTTEARQWDSSASEDQKQ